jgi:dephospho-CoA kinase
MLTIGLTGPTGAGKGAVASLLAAYGIPSIDTDAVYRELLVPPSPLLDELAATFGAGILTPSGELDRVALSAKVFTAGCQDQLERLNSVTHPHILNEVRRRLAVYGRSWRDTGAPIAVMVDAPQLYESGFDRECEIICSVLAPKKTRLARIMARDGMTEERALARMRAQRSDSFYRKAGYVIVNDGDMERLEEEVSRFYRYVRRIGG